MPFFGFLLRMTAAETADFVSKIVRVLLFYIVALFGIAVLTIYKKLALDKEFGKYLLCILFLSLPYLFHFLFSKSRIEEMNIVAMNELVIFLYMILIFALLSIISFKSSDYYFTVLSFVFFGIILSSLSIWFSLSMTPERYLDRFVGGFLRAGTEVTDPNLLGALLNLCSMTAIGLYLFKETALIKTFSILSFLIIQAGRFLTFSTGSFFNILISLLILPALLPRKHRGKMFKLFIIIITLSTVVIVASGLAEVLFYRITFSDEAAKESSIYSRIDQHREFIRLLEEKPIILFYGVGSAKLPEMLNLPVTLHNSYLRPLAVGGLTAFSAFIFLYFLCFRNFFISFKYTSDLKMKLLIAIFFSAFIGWSFQAATLPFEASGINLFFFTIAYSLKRTVWREYENHNIAN